jgi:hypothetical protein
MSLEKCELTVMAAVGWALISTALAVWVILRGSRLESEKDGHEREAYRLRGILHSFGYEVEKPSAMQAAAAAALARVVDENLKAELAKLPPPDLRPQLVKQKKTGTK